MNRGYIPPNTSLWKGRSTDSSLGPLYYYQNIELINKNLIPSSISIKSFGLLGYECDEGVRRNLGRVGAALGPNKIRAALSKLAYHKVDSKVYDFGSITCIDKNLEKCQEETSDFIAQMILKGIKPIILGGGHDLAYANFTGIQKALNYNGNIGIINFDAHLDLRKPNPLGNSGTPFFQSASLCNSKQIDFKYMAIGIRPESNTKDLFETAERNNVKVLVQDRCNWLELEKIKDEISDFIQQSENLYVTIDLDAFPISIAPGVSASSPVGLDTDVFFILFKEIINSSKVISLDVVEMNPTYDNEASTAKLAARIVDFYIRNSS